MPRFARPHVTGGLFHVICRFHNHTFLLDVEGARSRYLDCMANALSRTDARLFAYCLMSSHVHLVIQLGTQPLGSFTGAVNASWVGWLNRKTGRIGTAMAGRPMSVLCDSETYALELVRYVHNNPVRAGIVSRADQSSWSSHRAYLGQVTPPDWLDIEPVLGRLADDVEDARNAFADYVDSGRLDPRRPEFSGEMSREMGRYVRGLTSGPVEISYPVLGPDEFIIQAFGKQARSNEDREQFARVSIGAADVLHAVCAEIGLDRELLLSKSRIKTAVRGRKLVAWIWCTRLGRPQTSVADLFDTRPHAVTQILSRIRSEDWIRKEADTVERIVRRIRRQVIKLRTGTFLTKSQTRLTCI